MAWTFDLETAIAAWRRPFEHNRAFAEEDIEELEGSLRDRIDALVSCGRTEEEAFRAAAKRIGPHGNAEEEYRKVFWGKVRRQGLFKTEIRWRFALTLSFLKTAWRVLVRNKGYSLLNIVGLAVGLSCAFLIVLWMWDEMNYDRFHEHSEQLYRVRRHVQFEGGPVQTKESVPWPLATELRALVPEIKDVALITWPKEDILDMNDRPFRTSGVHADPSFFTMFSWGVVQGDEESLLQDRTSIALSQSTAERLFGPVWMTNAVGSTVLLNQSEVVTVSGVFRDVPRQSTLMFDYVRPLEAYETEDADNWGSNSMLLYVRLHDGVDDSRVAAQMVDMQNANIQGYRSDLFLQSYTAQHLHSAFEDGVPVMSQAGYYVRMFGVVAGIIVLIAGMNFTNLCTAQSLRRAREIGVRKAIGAPRSSLIGQFMGESVLLVGMAFVLSLGLVVMALPGFNDATGKAVFIDVLWGNTFYVFAGMAFVTALIAGAYPALHLTSFDAVSVLRGFPQRDGGTAFLRQGLVVFQFAMSTVLIVGTITIYRQMNHIHSMDTGIDRQDIVSVAMDDQLRDQWDLVKTTLLQRAEIQAVTAANASPLDISNSTFSVSWPGKAPDDRTDFHVLSVAEDFVDVMRMDVVLGDGFGDGSSADSIQYLINEQALDVMGIASPIGQRIGLWNSESGAIVGVVHDFTMTSLYNTTAPTIIRLQRSDTNRMFIRTQPGMLSEVLAHVEDVFRRLRPGVPVAAYRLDGEYRSTYSKESVVGALFGTFALVALFIAGLGLLGLAALTAQARTREIGIRKILGAGVLRIMGLLSRDFLRLVGIALVIAVPISWIVMNRWLDGFAYHVELSVSTFLAAGIATLGIAVLTVGFQAARAAMSDPVACLRHD